MQIIQDYLDYLIINGNNAEIANKTVITTVPVKRNRSAPRRAK